MTSSLSFKVEIDNADDFKKLLSWCFANSSKLVIKVDDGGIDIWSDPECLCYQEKYFLVSLPKDIFSFYEANECVYFYLTKMLFKSLFEGCTKDSSIELSFVSGTPGELCTEIKKNGCKIKSRQYIEPFSYSDKQKINEVKTLRVLNRIPVHSSTVSILAYGPCSLSYDEDGIRIKRTVGVLY